MASVTRPTSEPLTDRLATALDTAFPDLVRATQNGLYAGVLRLVGDDGATEDICQEAYLRAYRALSAYDADRIRRLETKPWLWTIALNLVRNRYRRRGPQLVPLMGIEPHDGSADPEAAALRNASNEAWAQRLDALPGHQRTAVVLRHVAGLTYREIAHATGRALGTCKSDVHRALSTLARALEREEHCD